LRSKVAPPQVCSGAERAPRAGDDHGAHGVVGVGAVEGVDQLVHHRGREGIELVGTVERERQDAVGGVVEDGLVGHGAVLQLAVAG
jgi:hypothetical protein